MVLSCDTVYCAAECGCNVRPHRAQRSQIRPEIRSIFTVQIDLVGAKLEMFNIRDLMTGNAIFFHLGDDPFTPGGLGVFFGKRSFPNESRSAE